jgi:glycerophosphoryl diester phosphodiesterase
MIDSLGSGYQYMGIATSSTTPGTPDQKVFYIAGPGEYSNFNAATVPDGFIGVFKYNGSWTVQTVAVGKNYDAQIRKVALDADQIVEKSLYENSFVQGISYEMGNITITGGTWTYGNSTTRVRTPENYILHLYPGDKIGLSNYSNARFYIGGHYTDGTYVANGWRTSDYTVLKEGNFCVLISNTTDTVQTSPDALGSLVQIQRNTTTNKRITALEQFQDGITILADSELVLFQDNKYIAYRGDVVSSAAFKILSLAAKKGDYIFVYANNSSAVSVFSKDVGLTNYDSLMVGGASNNEYRYVVPEDGIIYISINKNSTNRVLVIRNQQYAALLSINKTAYTNVVDFLARTQGYIKFSDGSFNATSSLFYVYQIPATGLKRIKVYVTGGDNIPAAIAFYSSNVVSAANYLGGVQMEGNTGGGRWYETDVPSTAALICVTNHHSYVPNPYILIDKLTRALIEGDEELPTDALGIGIVDGYKKIDNLSGTFIPIYSLNSYFPIQSFQEKIRGAAIYGIRCNVQQAGTLTIVKATGVLTDNCVMTTIKTFTTTKTGWQVLLFDAPVILSASESIGIGIQTDTARLVVDSQGGTLAIQSNYLHYTQNQWVTYGANMLIDVLGIPNNDVVAVSERVTSLEKSNVYAGNNPFRFNGPWYAHLFLDKIYQDSTNIVIPSESLEDIRVSRRLGFNVIEANVQTTSDGKFVVIHGSSGKFGYEVTDLNGEFTYADTAINSVTLDWIKANIRYRSDIPRYRTQIPTLEEFLTECRLQSMVPFSQASTAEMVAILDKIMGYGNYFAYNGTRALTSAPIVQYLSFTTKEAILERARSFGVPYVYAMGNPTAFTDEELADIVQSLHAEGFMIAAAYVSGNTSNRVMRLGFDMLASTYSINKMDNANLCTLSSGFDWNDFALTDVTPDDNGITLNVDQIIEPATIPPVVFLGRSELQITFSGTIYVVCGRENAILTSDGKHPMFMGSYYFNESPTFKIYGQSAGATITDVLFKASKC